MKTSPMRSGLWRFELRSPIIMDTKFIDGLFLELSQITQAKTAKEFELEKNNSRLLNALRGLTGIVTKKDGEAMLAGLRMMPVPNDEMPAMVEAVKLLMEFSECE